MIGIILGTGPSLNDSKPNVLMLQDQGALIFGVNNTYQDFNLDVWIACDPAWHRHYGKIDLPHTDQWYWDRDICTRHGYTYIEGRWFDGLSTDKSWISLNHCSGAQALNLAVHYGCDPILLVGHDFRYEEGKPRHYFSGLSDVFGEYPQQLRKWSLFSKPEGNDLMRVYKHIADQQGLPRIINCTPGSALKCFEMGELKDYL